VCVIILRTCRWGTLPWKTLVEPSIALAKGWTIQVELGQRITVRPSHLFRLETGQLTHPKWFPELMLGNPDWSAVFAPRGRFLREGEVVRRTNYSRTLATIASEGPDAFYKVHWSRLLCAFF
jgi:gamma-glutamyltranspeptidase/glutathione hydrolase/leukotriene-C4 hydrolase